MHFKWSRLSNEKNYLIQGADLSSNYISLLKEIVVLRGNFSCLSNQLAYPNRVSPSVATIIYSTLVIFG